MGYLVVLFSVILSQSSWASDSDNGSTKIEDTSSDQLEIIQPKNTIYFSTKELDFQWSHEGMKVQSQRITIYRKQLDLGGVNETILTFDLLADVQNLKFPGQRFPPGSYSWEIQIYDKASSTPIHQTQQSFEVLAEETLNIKTDRMYAVLGSGRGNYKSSDNLYNIDFNVSPIQYGIGYAGGSQSQLYEIEYIYSDFTVAGSLKKNQSFAGSYVFRIFGESFYDSEIYIGPALSFSTFPVVSTTDGTNVETNDGSNFKMGLNVTYHKMIGRDSSFYIAGKGLMPVSGSNSSKAFSFQTSLGVIYNLKWPFGVGGEVAYISDRYNDSGMNGALEIESGSFMARAKAIYSF